MHKPRIMRCCQTAASLPEHIDDFAPRPFARLQPRAQTLACNKLHGDKDFIAHGADVIHTNDVGVGEASHGLGFAQQAVTSCSHLEWVCLSRPQKLEGNLAVEFGIVGGIDDAHRPTTDEFQN